MAKVTGIGGFFYRSADPARSTAWYAEHLGVLAPPESYAAPCWEQDAGPTVVAAMPPDSEHLGPAAWGINFRTDDLDALVADLRAAGIEVTVHAETYPNGRFADLHDPDGNPVQLWEPGGVTESL